MTTPNQKEHNMSTQTETQAKPQHTPGPWAWWYVGNTPGDGCLRLDAASGQNILITDKTDKKIGWNPRPSPANQSLIAAAPDLLEALRHAEWKLRDMADWLTAYAENRQAVSVHAHAEECATAIAKAEGQS